MSKSLPQSLDRISISNLERSFADTTNSYKFYWFLALLECIKTNPNSFAHSIDDIAIEMMCLAWFPINRFHLSHGIQDKLAAAVNDISVEFNCPDNIPKSELRMLLKRSVNSLLVREKISGLCRYVPYRYLSSWFRMELKSMPDWKRNLAIKNLSQLSAGKVNDPCIYEITDNEQIRINGIWFRYLTNNLSVLSDFAFWNLLRYLEQNNPNVPNIGGKLVPVGNRRMTIANRFWDKVFEMKGSLSCIYSGEEITIGSVSIDHFLPWSFVAHDQLWNLVPTLAAVNSSKGDCLPSSMYLSQFASLQYHAYELVFESGTHRNLLEDYMTLFKLDDEGISRLSRLEFETKMIENINPLLQIGRNMGFKYEWEYRR